MKPAPLTSRDFHRLRELIHRLSGICLTDAKRELLVARLSPRLRALGIATFAEYAELVAGHDTEERARMVECMCTHETAFFREPRHFEILGGRVLPEWRARALARGGGPLRVWSAGCATGEEVYSLAMTARAAFRDDPHVRIEVLGTDLSSRALAVARRGVWKAARAREIPPAHLRAFMLRGTGPEEGNVAAARELRAVVELRHFNLVADTYPFRGAFDVIFCRNVLIYFDPQARAHVIEELAASLAPGGTLFLGHAETAGPSPALAAVAPSVYRAARG